MPTPTTAARPRSRIGTVANTLIVALGFLLSRVLGLGREVIISHQFGTSVALDAFRAPFAIIDLIYIVIAGGALGTAFIPVFSQMLTEGREDDAWRLASEVLRLALVGLTAACVLVAIFAEPLVAATVGRGFDAPTRALAVTVLRLTLVQPLLLGLGGLAKAALESFDRFATPVLAANIYNLGIIGGALLAPWMGVYGLVLGVDAGAALFLLVQLPGLAASGARLLRGAGLRTPGVGQVGRLIGPRLFGQAVWQINLIAVSSFASLAGQGAVAANGYAMQLMLLPHGLLALSVGTVIFPQLARLHAAGESEALRERAVGALRAVLFLAVPASALLGALAAPAVHLLFERGAFDARSAAMTADALRFYMLGLAAFTASEIMVRTFYAMQDTRTPVVIGCAAVAANVALGYGLLRAGYGLGGLALSFSAANTLEAALLVAALRGRIGGLGAGFWPGLARVGLAGAGSLAAALAARSLAARFAPALVSGQAYRWPDDFLGLAAAAAAVGLAGALAYAALAALMRAPELAALARRARRRGAADPPKA